MESYEKNHWRGTTPSLKKTYTHKKFRLFYQHTSITVQCTFTYCLSHGWLPYKFLIPLTIIQIVHDHQYVFKNKLLVNSWTRSLNSNNIQFNCIMFIPLKQRISIEHNLKDTLHKFLVVYSDCTMYYWSTREQEDESMGFWQSRSTIFSLNLHLHGPCCLVIYLKHLLTFMFFYHLVIH